MATTRDHPQARNLTTIFVAVLWIAVLLAASVGRRDILDWWQLRGYVAPAAVAGLASSDTMTDYGRKVLYVNKPAIQHKTDFRTSCPTGTEQTVVLGCYHGDQGGIYVLQVTDLRLNGVEQVTIAHEMLHAAYDRLSAREKRSVNAMLMDYYHSGLSDPVIIDQIHSYQKSEPNDVVNEMHSLFGTEVSNLPANLEQYYQRYFSNRKAVAADYAKYQAEFTSRQTAIATDDTQLATWKIQITSQEASLQAQLTKLTAQKTSLEAQRNQGDIGAYNAAVPGLNAAVDGYNAQVDALHVLIANYNQLVATRNSIALEDQQLVNDISAQVSNF